MRKRFPMLLLAAAIGCTQGGAPDSIPADSTEISASTESSIPLPDPSATVIKFFCPGMTWGGCRATVNSTLQSLPGVANVEISAEDTTATVTVDPEKFSAADAVAALSNSGFPAQTATAVEPASTEEAAADEENVAEEAAEEETGAAPAEQEEGKSEEAAAESEEKAEAAESADKPAEPSDEKAAAEEAAEAPAEKAEE